MKKLDFHTATANKVLKETIKAFEGKECGRYTLHIVACDGEIKEFLNFILVRAKGARAIGAQRRWARWSIRCLLKDGRTFTMALPRGGYHENLVEVC